VRTRERERERDYVHLEWGECLNLVREAKLVKVVPLYNPSLKRAFQIPNGEEEVKWFSVSSPWADQSTREREKLLYFDDSELSTESIIS